MRLNPEQVSAITQSAAQCFGPSARVWLFGSRTDDRRRGGDIDLLVETETMSLDRELDARNRFIVNLQMRIGEQKIDVILTGRDTPDERRVVQIARQSGVLLS